MKKQMIIHPEELSRKWIDKMTDAKVEVLGIHPRGGRHAVEALKELLSLLKKEEYKELLDYACSKGLEIEYEIHSAGYLMPRELFEECPQFFRMDEKGQRTNDWNFCVSNPEALALFSKRAAKLAVELYKSSHNFYFWMDDGKDFGCHCPKCKSLSFSDQQLIAVNAMLDGIREIYPDARMAYLAYYDSLTPPEKVKARDGVFLEYAPMEKYIAKGEDRDERIEKEKNMLLPLMELFSSQPAKVLEYWYDNSLYSNWKKPPKKLLIDEETMLREANEYKKTGFSLISTFACFLGEDYTELYGEADISAFGKI